MDTTLTQEKKRSFGGKLYWEMPHNTPQEKHARNVEKAHLSAYIKGQTHFGEYKLTHPTTGVVTRHQYKVIEIWT